MKKIYYVFMMVIMTSLCFGMTQIVIADENIKQEQLKISEENFPDEVIREKLNQFDKNYDDYLSKEEISQIRGLIIDKADLQDSESNSLKYEKLTDEQKAKRYCQMDLKGIDKLTEFEGITISLGSCKGYERKINNFNILYEIPKLKRLTLKGDMGIKNLKVYKFRNLKELELESSHLDKIQFGKKSKLEKLKLKFCKVNTTINISNLSSLKEFKADWMKCAGIKTGKKNKNIEVFYLGGDKDGFNGKANRKVRQLDFSYMKNLRKLDVLYFNNLRSMTFKNNNKLKKVRVIFCPKLKKVSIIKCKNEKRILRRIKANTNL